jgi:hypothetical protein
MDSDLDNNRFCLLALLNSRSHSAGCEPPDCLPVFRSDLPRSFPWCQTTVITAGCSVGLFTSPTEPVDLLLSSVTTVTSGCPVDRFRGIDLPERSIQKCHLRISYDCIQMKSFGNPKISFTLANSTKPKFCEIFHLSDSTSNELLTALVCL